MGCEMAEITVYEDINFGGRSFVVTADTGDLPDWQHRSASSFRISGMSDDAYTVFLETVNGQGDDELWVQGNGQLKDLRGVARPHGNNNWNDRISQILVNRGTPGGSNDNRTILYHGRRDYTDGNNPMRNLGPDNPNWGS